jgi:N-acetylglucosamine-6-phosphate deacetylase
MRLGVEAAIVDGELLRGRSDLGALRPGVAADIVVLDDRLDLQRVLLAGRPFEGHPAR